METITAINKQDGDRRLRAAQYEAALNTQTSAKVSIERSDKRAAAFAKQVTLLTKLIDQADGIDPLIDVTLTSLGNTICGSARNNVLRLLDKSKADQQRRLDAALKDLVKARSELARSEQTLAELA